MKVEPSGMVHVLAMSAYPQRLRWPARGYRRKHLAQRCAHALCSASAGDEAAGNGMLAGHSGLQA
jgi:hypothetical protein